MEMDGVRGDWAALLRQKGIRPGGFFALRGGYYAWSRSGRLSSLSGDSVALTENELWESFDQLRRVGRAEFEQARAARLRERLACYGLSPGDIERLAQRFLAAEQNQTEDWRFICQFAEEPIRYILQRVAEASGEGNPQRRFDRLFKQVALAKAEAALNRRQKAAGI